MYQPRTIIRVPVHRIAKSSPALARSASMCGAPSFSFSNALRSGPPSSLFAPLANDREFAPLMRLLDDFISFPRQAQQVQRPAQPSFTPRFDVREVDKIYELRGELPGVESKDLEIMFTDAETLVIRGSTAQESSSGNPASEVVSATEPATDSAQLNATTDVDNSDAQSTSSTSSYVKPSVEDEEPTSNNEIGSATPSSSKASEAQTLAEAKGKERETGHEESQTTSDAQPQSQQEQSRSRYWITERNTGSFLRTFTFAGRINHDGVTASLKNGVLSMVIPKAEPLSVKRISVL